MGDIELHYSRARLAKLALFGIIMGALAIWLLSGSVELEREGGRYAGLVAMIGPSGVRALMWLFLIMCIGALFSAFRLMFSGNLMAARATPDGVEARTLFGLRDHQWSELEPVTLKRVHAAGREHLFVQFHALPREGQNAFLHHFFGRSFGFAANQLLEDADEIEDWVAQANALRAAREESQPGRAPSFA